MLSRGPRAGSGCRPEGRRTCTFPGMDSGEHLKSTEGTVAAAAAVAVGNGLPFSAGPADSAAGLTRTAPPTSHPQLQPPILRGTKEGDLASFYVLS